MFLCYELCCYSLMSAKEQRKMALDDLFSTFRVTAAGKTNICDIIKNIWTPDHIRLHHLDT